MKRGAASSAQRTQRPARQKTERVICGWAAIECARVSCAGRRGGKRAAATTSRIRPCPCHVAQANAARAPGATAYLAKNFTPWSSAVSPLNSLQGSRRQYTWSTGQENRSRRTWRGHRPPVDAARVRAHRHGCHETLRRKSGARTAQPCCQCVIRRKAAVNDAPHRRASYPRPAPARRAS